MRRMLLLILTALTLMSSGVAAQSNRIFERWLRKNPKITDIVLEGQEHFDEGKIRSRLYSRKSSLWARLRADRRIRVRGETRARDTLEIKYLYLTNGFPGIRVDHSLEMILPDSTARVRITIDEGRRFFYDSTRIVGDYDKRFVIPMRNISRRLKYEDPFNHVRTQQVAFDMKEEFANNGFPYAGVSWVLDTNAIDSLAAVVFTLTSDSIVHFGKVDIIGDLRFPRRTVRRELKVKEGEVYRRRSIIDSQRRLAESGFFRTFNITSADTTGDRYRPDFTVRVRERKQMYLTVTTGAGQSHVRELEWDFATRYGIRGARKFLGPRKLDFGTVLKFGQEISEDRGKAFRLVEHDYSVRLTEPWLLGLRMPLILTGQWEPGVKDPEREFRVQSWSVSAATTKLIGEKHRIDFGAKYESVVIFGVPDDEVQSLKDEQEISVRRNVYFRFRRDTRDHIFAPSNGSLFNFNLEYYGGFLGGDDNFVRTEWSWSRYQPMWPGWWIGATRLRFDRVKSFPPSSEVPFNDRYYLGGANSVRGFRVNTLGPADSLGNPEKSSYVFLFNHEFRWKTVQLTRPIPFIGAWPLWQSVSFDMGNGHRHLSDFSLESMAYSVGTGLQLHSPFGPIRIDHAWRLPSKDIDVDSRWHFTILYAF